MLIQEDKHWVVCMPAKCGARHLINAAHKTRRTDIKEHRVHVGFRKIDRSIWRSAGYTYLFLQVRDPLERLCSMYYYIRDCSSRAYKDDPDYFEYMRDFPSFLDKWAWINSVIEKEGDLPRGKKRQLFWPALRFYLDNFDPDYVIPIESTQSLYWMLSIIGIDPIFYKQASPHNNPNRPRLKDVFDPNKVSSFAKTWIEQEYDALEAHYSWKR